MWRDAALFGMPDRASLNGGDVGSVRPSAFGGLFPRSSAKWRWSAASILTVASVAAAHAGLIMAVAANQRDAPDRESGIEIPIEIVVEALPAASDEPAVVAARSVETAPPSDLRMDEEATAQPGSTIDVPEPARTEAAAKDIEPEEAEHAWVATLPPAFASAAPATREAPEARSASRAHRARNAGREKSHAEPERRAEPRKAEGEQKREMTARARLQLASISPGHAERDAQRAQFDAASYRAIVARAVSAAVGRSCPATGGGRVVVALLINSSGQIASASLSGASGNAALDSAAVAAVRRSGPFPAPSSRSNVSVPVAVTCR
jgi:periplasmic protein TonB